MAVVTRTAKTRGARLGRSDRSSFGMWFWEIDRVLLLLVFVLVSVGLIAVAAASPAAASRYSGGSVTVAPLYYFWRQLMWVAVGVPLMVGISMMPRDRVRRFALFGAAFFSILLLAVPIFGSEANGARRWIGYGAASLQPSEFLKPCFVVALAWLLSLRAQDRSLPVIPLSGALVGVIALFLMKQPDFGQTIIFVTMWLALLMLTGVSFRVMGALAGAGGVGIVMAYLFYPVATQRIDNFLFQTGDTFQVDSARATLTAGGFFGTGPGGGEKKFGLPEAQTDYIFSVIGEEFGLIACIAVAVLFLAIAVRVFVKLLDEDEPFVVLASAGLVTQLTVQAFINMAVNVGLAPSKGMTLPFISYGGSSMIALCLGFGMLLAFTRRNPYLKRSPYVVKWNSR
ncbi:MAG: putative peptidoglycan glycosyltransferase FtsW [Sphingomonadales bacterium]